MNSTDVLLLAFDNALTHPWESFTGATEDLSAAETAWQPPAYAQEPHDPGVGKPGTVLWFLNHLELCHRHYTTMLQQRRQRPREQATGAAPETQPAGELPLPEILAALKAANAALRDEIALLKADDLDTPFTPNKTTAEFVLGTIRHISWHSGQIATIRRLYRQ
ncbi:MAG: DinB family protein [Planctomycetes bacterium]|nr:DinB family protein [Planctomycetota bacterium]